MEEENIADEGMTKTLSRITADRVDREEIDSNELTSAQIKKKYKAIIDEAFTKMTEDTGEIFTVAYTIISEFNISPEGFVMCLNKDNRLKLRNFADNNFDTNYYKKKEREKLIRRRMKKGQSYDESEDISKFFK